jgi:hypothetical protein
MSCKIYRLRNRLCYSGNDDDDEELGGRGLSWNHTHDDTLIGLSYRHLAYLIGHCKYYR